jgi:peptide/nickel transport system permease protein/oligopeptide transport system permease protein
MLNYTLKRLLASVFILLGISLLLFVMLRSLPGDPAIVLAGELATNEDIVLIRQELGLDQPIYVQYGRFLNRLIHFELGRSARTRDPVIYDITARLPNTLVLTVTATFLACLMGIPAGVLSAMKPHSWIDYLATSLALFGISMPVFWLGLMMVFVFSVILKWLPAGGTGGIQHLIMPSLSLAAFLIAFIARMTRASMLEALSHDYVTTARSKGLSERVVIFRHTLKNALIPIITVIGLQFGRLLGGAVLTETVFAWPGIGRLLVDSITARDYPMVQGAILIFGLLFVLVNLIVDLSYVVVDPRIHYD